LKLQQQKLPTYIPMSRKSHKFAGFTAFEFYVYFILCIFSYIFFTNTKAFLFLQLT